MTEEFIYDRRRITIVVIVASLIVCSGIILVGLWPKPTPPIGDVITDTTVIIDADIIGEKYTELFNGTIDTNNTMMVKVSVYASTVYYAERLTFTLSVEEGGFTPILALAIVQMANEANILTGKNDFLADQTIYTNTLMITPSNYVIYFILDISEGIEYNYNVRISE